MNTLLWVIIPYLSIVVFVGGLVWRRRYDKFGWTTRSSQLYESAILRWGSPLFHFGVLLVLVGHVGGLLVPKSWTEAVGVTEHTYHLTAVFLGTVAGLCTLIGMAILIARRRLVGPVFTATTRNDKAMYVVLGGVIVLGMWATVRANVVGDGYDYRERSRRGSARCSYCSPIRPSWPVCRAASRFTSWPRSCCSRSGHSPGSCTLSAHRSAI